MKKCLLVLLLPHILVGCSPLIVNPEEDPTPGPGPEPKASTYSVDFTTYSIDTIADFDSQNANTYKAKLKTMFNSKEDVLSDVSITGYTQYKTNELKDGSKLRAFLVCSGTQDGSVTLTFNRKITSFTISAQSYFKFFLNTYDDPGNPYWVCSCDAISEVNVNEDTISLPTIDIQTQTLPETITKSYNLNAYTVTLSGMAAQRAFIKKITVTLEDE